MIVSKVIGIILTSIFLANSSEGQNIGNSKDENIPIKTIGLIDVENICNLQQEKYIDSIALAFYKRTSIRTVVITCDTLSRFSLFMKVRELWGYTDTEIKNDIAIVMTTNGKKMIAFYDNWVESFLGSDTVDMIVRGSLGPDFKSGFYFEALNKLLNSLYSEIERKLN